MSDDADRERAGIEDFPMTEDFCGAYDAYGLPCKMRPREHRHMNGCVILGKIFSEYDVTAARAEAKREIERLREQRDALLLKSKKLIEDTKLRDEIAANVAKDNERLREALGQSCVHDDAWKAETARTNYRQGRAEGYRQGIEEAAKETEKSRDRYEAMVDREPQGERRDRLDAKAQAANLIIYAIRALLREGK